MVGGEIARVEGAAEGPLEWGRGQERVDLTLHLQVHKGI